MASINLGREQFHISGQRDPIDGTTTLSDNIYIKSGVRRVGNTCLLSYPSWVLVTISQISVIPLFRTDK